MTDGKRPPARAAYGDLAAFFAPRSVAIVGASGDAAKFGGRVLSYFLQGGYGGRVHAVNARQKSVQGLRAVPSLTAIGEPVDLAVLALPMAACADAARECVATGVKAAILFASGFGESGAAGAARQQEITRVARQGGLRLLGPNCIGLVSEPLRGAATFATMWQEGWPAPGPVSIVSQSGALASYFHVLLRQRGVGIAQWCSTGNEADVDVAECIAYYALDGATRVIVAALEGVNDGRRLLAALELARRARKPVILLKLGRSAIGSAAAASHTGALATDDRVFDAAVTQAGALRCADFERAVDVAAACALGIYPRGRRLGIVSASGGAGIMVADRAEECGIDVPELEPALRDRLDALIPGGASRNPVDVTAMVLNDVDLMTGPIKDVALSTRVDAAIAFLTSAFRSDESVSALLERVKAANLQHLGKPVMFSLFSSPENLARFQAAGFAAYVDPVRAVDALHALLRLREGWDRAARASAPLPALAAPAATDEAALLELLAAHGVPVAKSVLVRSAADAEKHAVSLGPTVVMKVAIAGLAHKSEMGGVITKISTPAQAAAAYAKLVERARAAGLERRLQGIVVQRQLRGVMEMLFGARRDPAFGVVVTLGMGGKWVEILDDIAIRVAPIDAAEARRMIAGLRGAALLRGARDQPAADIEALAMALAAFSQLAVRLTGLESMEVNPFILGKPGQGGRAADAKLVLRA